MFNILVTGGCGFIGTNFIRYFHSKYKEYKIINLDKLTYAGNKINLFDIENSPNYQFIQGDIANTKLVENILEKFKPIFIINFAAESHVDRSIIYPEEFINTNILGTFKLLTSVNNYFSKLTNKEKGKFRFMHISTDEVYGSLKPNSLPFREENKYFPNSPYSASKASSDHIVRSFFKTYDLPVLISNCSNNYGPYQSIEKLIPLTIFNAINKKKIPVYGNGKNIRDWLFVQDHCEAIEIILMKSDPGEVYNIGCSNEIKNIDVVKTICDVLDSIIPLNKSSKIKNYEEYITFIKDRPGHDFRYSVDSSKIKSKLGWEPKTIFKVGIKKTVKWYLSNLDWIQKIADSEYSKWIKTQY